MSQLVDSSAAPAAPYEHIEVRQVGGVIGAVVSGIRVGSDIEPAAFAELRAALLRHRVLFLRDQHPAGDHAAALRRHHRVGQHG
jgi:alpha-ketoglutarate-dependent sulfate ester dioxygenase